MCVCVLITYNKQISKFQDFHFRKNFVKMKMRVFNCNSQCIKLLSTLSVFHYFKGRQPNSSKES